MLRHQCAFLGGDKALLVGVETTEPNLKRRPSSVGPGPQPTTIGELRSLIWGQTMRHRADQADAVATLAFRTAHGTSRAAKAPERMHVLWIERTKRSSTQ